MIDTWNGEYTYTPEELKQKIVQYFQTVERESKFNFPDEAGLLNFLDISDEEYSTINADEEYAEPLRFAIRRRRSFLMRLSIKDPKTATACMNLLKQPENGGMVEKGETKQKKFVVKLEGIMGDKKENE